MVGNLSVSVLVNLPFAGERVAGLSDRVGRSVGQGIKTSLTHECCLKDNDQVPGVLEGSVIGVLDDKLGEAPKAFVVKKPGHQVGLHSIFWPSGGSIHYTLDFNLFSSLPFSVTI